MSTRRALEKQLTPQTGRLRNQSATRRRRRLQDGRCPLHGQVMELRPVEDSVVALCPLRGCGMRAWLQDGSLRLEPHLAEILEPNHVDDVELLTDLARRIRATERRLPDAARAPLESLLHALDEGEPRSEPGDDGDAAPPPASGQRSTHAPQ
ncbi:MAG: hypothetical protein NVS3B10_10610 [Polyangiales bacterium]